MLHFTLGHTVTDLCRSVFCCSHSSVWKKRSRDSASLEKIGDSQVKPTVQPQIPISIIIDAGAQLSPLPKALALSGRLCKELFGEQHGEELHTMVLPWFTNGRECKIWGFYLVKSFYSSWGLDIQTLFLQRWVMKAMRVQAFENNSSWIRTPAIHAPHTQCSLSLKGHLALSSATLFLLRHITWIT